MPRTGESFLYEAPYCAVLPRLALTVMILSLDPPGRALATALEDRHEVADPIDPVRRQA